MKERLQKIIARSGIGSRRKAEELIRQGRVIVNGQIVTQMGTLADPAIDEITVDEIELAEPENKVYLLLHKPQGCVTSLHDPEGRTTIDQLYDDIPERLYPVGRLDYDTEGLLVVTNDGMFSQLLQHPSHGIEKKYLVKVKGIPVEAALKRLRDGVVIEGRKTSRSGIRLVKKSLKSSWCEVVLHEGLNRQLKKMFEFIGYPTLRIIRTTIGPLQLGRLPVGTYRFLTKAEIEAVKEYGAAGAKVPARSVPEKNIARRSARPDRPVRTPRPERSRTSGTTKTISASERSRTSVTAKSRTSSDRSRPSATAKPRTGSDRSRKPAASKPRTGSDRSRSSATAKPRTVSSRRPKK